MAKRLIRTYRCQCGHEWQSVHRLDEPPLDDCPKCSQNSLPHTEENNFPKIYGKAPGLKTNVSKAADFTARMLESDYGIPPSMLVDNAREGDAYVKVPEPKPMYMDNGQALDQKTAQQIIGKQLQAARANNGIGPQNVNGVDFVKSLNIPDPRKTAEFMSTRD